MQEPKTSYGRDAKRCDPVKKNSGLAKIQLKNCRTYFLSSCLSANHSTTHHSQTIALNQTQSANESLHPITLLTLHANTGVGLRGQINCTRLQQKVSKLLARNVQFTIMMPKQRRRRRTAAQDSDSDAQPKAKKQKRSRCTALTKKGSKCKLKRTSHADSAFCSIHYVPSDSVVMLCGHPTVGGRPCISRTTDAYSCCGVHTKPVPWRSVRYLQTLLLKTDALKEQPSSIIQLIAEFSIGAVKQCAYARCSREVLVSAEHKERFLEEGCSVHDHNCNRNVIVRWVYLDNATGEKYLYDHSTGKAFCDNCKGKNLRGWLQEINALYEKRRHRLNGWGSWRPYSNVPEKVIIR